jgi:hypothetical protein
VALAATHIGILSVDDRVTHMYFHFVAAGCDVQNLRIIVVRRCLSGLYAIYKDERTHWGAGYDELGRFR